MTSDDCFSLTGRHEGEHLLSPSGALYVMMRCYRSAARFFLSFFTCVLNAEENNIGVGNALAYDVKIAPKINSRPEFNILESLRIVWKVGGDFGTLKLKFANQKVVTFRRLPRPQMPLFEPEYKLKSTS